MTTTSDIRVSVDVGCHHHSGLPIGQVLDEFDMEHRPEGFNLFFQRIEDLQENRDGKPGRKTGTENRDGKPGQI
jgi:hypothetical protein